MKHALIRTSEGRARVLCCASSIDPAPFVEECLASTRSSSGVRRTLGGVDVIVKAGPLSPSGTRRHFQRRVLLGASAPCEAEFRNLRWLRERLFRVPEAVAAVTIFRRGRPVRQLLATQPLEDLSGFRDGWTAADDGTRSAWASEFGLEVGRMHALRFLHGDLYPRNVLAGPTASHGGPGHGRALAWLDAWSAGPTAWRRGSFRRVEQDLGAWFSLAADWMSSDHQATLLRAYVSSRAANGRPVRSLDGLVLRIQRARRTELARLERDRRRLRGAPFPCAGWDPPLEAKRRERQSQ